MFGVTSFRPVGDLVQGVGARFEAEMTLGPKVLQSTIEVVEWEQDKVITVESVGGGGSVSSWRFDAASRHETRLSVEFNYMLAGPVRASALLSEPVLGQAIRHAEGTLCRRLEESYFGDG
ncbi:SRPBCC family protein [Rhodococcus qingshengii]|uniref:SRPBCC family protein n=1 Tax=Rhodococcus qingshengii TaxID=334542 RepID=UPI001BEC76EA|nr:SRPBCC family protein [Rhodococcus qingshengii]MBT2270681.1 SRPBCC family protein [Rhodococcus qingshengii]